MDEIKNIKSKFLGLINKQQGKNVKIPAMGFSDYFIQNLSTTTTNRPSIDSNKHQQQEFVSESNKLSDQEILESTEEIYFQDNVNTEVYELKKFQEDEFNGIAIEQSMLVLKQQHKVISKKVLQLILEQRNSCNTEFEEIGETEKMLNEAVHVCRKVRTNLGSAKKNLTTTSLEILATYKKREILMELLKTLNTIKKMKSTDSYLQQLLAEGNYSGAISILLECKNSASENHQYKCVEALSQKLQDTLILTEVQLDSVLNEMTQSFDNKKYSKLQDAYKQLGKTLIAMDALHMNFISAIHTNAYNCVRVNMDQTIDEKQKLLFEQMCENVPADKFIVCLISLCKSFWNILVCYYQVTMWHHNFNLFETDEELSHDEYIEQKLKKGQLRIWNDIQSKICVFLMSSKLHQLKFEQFIQVLSVVQRLKKVGVEFCNENSSNLMENMKKQSLEFFKRYHASCLEEVSLFLENEAWVPIGSFSNVVQLQEFRSVKSALQRHKIYEKIEKASVTKKIEFKQTENESSVNSQDGSSIYGLCGYFLRFAEKSSPFDGGFDESMLEEDILAGIADEASGYFSEEEIEVDDDELNKNGSVEGFLTVSSTSLTVLRCIGRYLQMCRLLHSISPEIVSCMTELIDFYIYSVHFLFGKDLPVSAENLYSSLLNQNLKRISERIIPKVKNFPPSNLMIEMDLKDAEQLYGLTKRIVGVESCICLVQQFEELRGYLEYLSQNSELKPLENFFQETISYVYDLRKPVYMSVTSRVVDIQQILTAMSKVKWDINHVTVQHSSYIDSINRGIQTFAMRLEEVSQMMSAPKESIWDNLAHFLTHILVEGYSNAKKCSTGGRALMQLDLTHFLSILELISGFKHPIHQSYVELYVKSFYLPKDLLEEWIKENIEKSHYSMKHLTGLVLCTCSNDKKTRQKLMSLIENTTEIS